LLKHARPDALLHIVAAAIFEDDRLDALQMEEMGQNKARWPCSYNSDLCASVGH
jgi:hypothetical protein